MDDLKRRFQLLGVIGSVIAVVGLVVSLYLQLHQAEFRQTISAERLAAERTLDAVYGTLQADSLSLRLARIERALSMSSPLLRQSAIFTKIEDVESRIGRVEARTLALRQAINPLKPDEILTIARLTDEIMTLKRDLTQFQETITNRQVSFEASLRNEAKASNQSTNLILVVLVPLVLNFLYTVWKDMKQARKEQP
jgi:uncharacterized membrane protein YdbT with pleckstrin-like domain